MKKLGRFIFPVSIIYVFVSCMALSILIIGSLSFLGGLIDFMNVPMQDSRPVRSTESFERVWEQLVISSPAHLDHGLYLGNGVFLQIKEGQVIIPTNRANLANYSLETGRQNWKTPIISSSHIGSNSENVYFIQENYDPTPVEKIVDSCVSSLPICNSITIQAINISTGEELWSELYANILHVDRFTIDDEFINIEGNSGYSTFLPEYSIDASNGEFLTEFQGVSFPDEDDSTEKQIADLGFNNVISNYADNGQFIFFITGYNNTVWAVDKENQKIVGQIQFDGATFDTLYEQRSRGFVVESDENKVVVYLGDSGQLFVFDFVPPE